MAPILFRISFHLPLHGPVELPVYGFGMMLVLAFLTAPALACWRARREGLDPEIVLDMAFWIFVCGLVGARVFYCVQYWGRDIHNLWEALQYWNGGIVYYGSMIGALVGFFGFWWRRRFPVRAYLDVLAPSIAVGTMFGRLGCFLNGCCFGDPCGLPWSVTFPLKSFAWEHHARLGLLGPHALGSLPVHPTQLYSAANGLILFVLLTAFYPLRRRDGAVMGVLLVAYPVLRFLVEFVRDDETVFFAGMTISQTISVLVLAGSVLYWAWLLSLPAGRQGALAPIGRSASPATAVDALASTRS